MADNATPEAPQTGTQTNQKIVAQSPAIAVANVYQSVAGSCGQLVENAVNRQRLASELQQAVSLQGVARLYTTDIGELAALAQGGTEQRGDGSSAQKKSGAR